MNNAAIYLSNQNTNETLAGAVGVSLREAAQGECDWAAQCGFEVSLTEMTQALTDLAFESDGYTVRDLQIVRI